MYRRPKFLELLHEIREMMSRQSDYDMDLFVEKLRTERSFEIEIKLGLDEDSPKVPERKRKAPR